MERVNTFREQIKKFIRSSEDDREHLSLPYEYMLFVYMHEYQILPHGVGFLDQLQYNILCFNIIRAERASWENEVARIRTVNKQLQEQHDAKNKLSGGGKRGYKRLPRR